MDERLDIRTLGGLTVLRNGIPLTEFNQRKVPALLVYLARTQRAQWREVLAELFWEERTQAQSLGNLRTVLTCLRKTVGPFVEITRDSITMKDDSAGWRLDATEFETRLFTAGDEAQQLAEALDLYQGDFLEGFYIDSQGFEDWALVERERLRFLAVDALDTLIRIHLKQSDFAAGVARATQLLQLDPLREETHRHLMALLGGSGQRTAALNQFETCRRVLSEELGVEPSSETVALFERIRSGEVVQTVKMPPIVGVPQQAASAVFERPRHNLPAQSTSFVGREDELAVIFEQLAERDCRLLTLVGMGGIGKTRLALAAAEHLVEHFDDGVFFVALQPIQSPDDVVSAIASAIHFQFYSGDDSEQQQLLNHLRGKALLLALDNFEHLLEAVPFVDALLSAAPSVTILATSREPLSSGWECLFEVTGLCVPLAIEEPDVDKCSAIRLFVERAWRVRPTFRLADDRAAVIRICQRLGGVPLGIEIAAGWLRLMPAEAVAENLLDLETTRYDLPERQRSLRALFDETWARLTPAQQAALEKVSVFRGSFTQDAAETVTGATAPVLAGLVNKSLVQYDLGAGRFQLHELLCQYAEERLNRSIDTRSETLDRYADYYCGLLEHQQEIIAMGRVEAVVAEIDNIRAAWDWAIERGNVAALFKAARSMVQIFLPVWQLDVFLASGKPEDNRHIFECAVAKLRGLEPSRERDLAMGVCLVAVAAWTPGAERRLMYDEGLELLRRHGPTLELAFAGLWVTEGLSAHTLRENYEESLAIYTELGSKWGICATSVYAVHSQLETSSGNGDALKECCHRATALAREIGDDVDLVMSLGLLAQLEGRQGNHRQGLEYMRQGAAICRQCSYFVNLLVMALGIMVSLEIELGEVAEAEALADEAYSIAKQLGSPHFIMLATRSLGYCRLARGDYARARTYIEAAMDLAPDFSWRRHFCDILVYCHMGMRDLERAEALADEYYSVAQNVGSPVDFFYATDTLAVVNYLQGNYSKARELHDRCLLIAQSPPLDTSLYMGYAACQVGFDAGALEDDSAAWQYFETALRLAIDNRHSSIIADMLVGIGLLLMRAGKHDRALELAAVAARCRLFRRFWDEARLRHLLEAEFGPEAVHAAIERGKELDPIEFAREVLAELQQA